MSPENYPASRTTGLVKLKGKTYEEVFGPEKAKAMKEKMRLAKLGKKMPWNSVPERRGEKSPRWIKDRTLIVGRHTRSFHDSDYKRWRSNVVKRDNNLCRISNLLCDGRLEVHHILGWRDNPELRYEVRNGIALCHAHHPKRRAEEKRLAPYFQELVSVSKK